MRFPETRLDRQGFIVTGQSLCEPLQFRQRQPAVVERGDEVGMEGDCLVEMSKRVLRSIHKMERRPVTELRVGKVRRERERALKMDYRLVEPTEVFKALGQIVESNR